MNLIQKVHAVLEREGRLAGSTKIIAGVSGGGDSVALLHILQRLGYDVCAAHLNHSIRGAEADADEAFVKTLCEKLDMECITAKTDVPARAKEKGISLEMAAREARHAFFQSLSSDLCARTSVLCLAHHADDQIETFFLRAARGTGLTGLGGMRFFQTVEKVQICRPMLGIRKAEIIQWLETEGLMWREDASNTDETIPRNRVRHQILPILGKINDRAAENILRTMAILRDEDLRGPGERAEKRREARDQLIKLGVSPSFDAVERLIEFSKRTDGTRYLDLEGVRLVNEYGTIGRTVPGEPRTAATAVPAVRIEKGAGILRGKWAASVSAAKVAGRELTVRTPQPGDRMNPFGMEGSKKLQDIFTDLKIPKRQRATWPVVECGGEIVWLPGYRIARGWALSSEAEPALLLRAEA